MKIALAVVLFVHGIAHLPGFLVPWRIATLKDMPYKTTVVAGKVDIGDTGVRAVGVLWLAVGFAFAASGVGVIARVPWWRPVTMTAAALSFVLSIINRPDSRIGVLINAAIIAFLLVDSRLGWLS
jgi:hypothetical protein